MAGESVVRIIRFLNSAETPNSLLLETSALNNKPCLTGLFTGQIPWQIITVRGNYGPKFTLINNIDN